MNLRLAINVEDFRRLARRRLPKLVFDFMDGGVLDEYTRDANERDFRRIELRPKACATLTDFDPGTSVLGTDVSIPLLVSPMGTLTMFHPEGDAAIARAARKTGSIFMHSFVSGVTIEDTVAAIGDPDRVWAQTTLRTEEENEAYRRRVANLGIRTLMIAAETVGSDKRERDLHNGLASMPPRPPLKGLVDFALHPGWVYRWLTGPDTTFADHRIDGSPIRMSQMYSFMGEYGRPDWSALQRLRDSWDGNLVVKGIGTPEDALLAVDLGADALVVSNLGGRHFDGQPSTISVLPDIVKAVRGIGSSIDIIVDGGVRRGSDIVRALALGATAASAGRPFGYAIAAAGQEGAEKVFGIYREEFAATMKSVGASTVREIDSSVLHPGPLGAPAWHRAAPRLGEPDAAVASRH
jgi:isopentenyl diphosphate isomerase/L-lactate dehydrogenase-like FMN-dependent dehydrogenase